MESRARFAIEIAIAVAEEIGADRTAIRFSPSTTLWDIDESEEGPGYLIGKLDKLHLSYVHIMHQGNEQLLSDIRQLWTARLILNRLGRQRADIGKDVASGLADMEAYGQMILANLDFLARLKANAPLNEADRKTFFSGA
ncbi:hypothetical protein JK191_08900 [Gluconobacter sphaericus]|nr:hypothetical protein [Gluconobacter sphaericus]MBS1097686.1 hypothetical protein [Gluconobacter sphaericus]